MIALNNNTTPILKVGYTITIENSDYEYLVTHVCGQYLSAYAIGLNDPEIDVLAHLVTSVVSPDKGEMWKR